MEVTRLPKRSLNLRIKSSRQYAAAQDPKNDSHQYFNDILTNIYALFELAAAESTPNLKSDTDPEIITNKFAVLAVDDFEEDAEDVPDIQLPGVATSTEAASFEPEMSLGEAVNAVVIFLEDMERTREYVIALWRLQAGKGGPGHCCSHHQHGTRIDEEATRRLCAAYYACVRSRLPEDAVVHFHRTAWSLNRQSCMGYANIQRGQWSRPRIGKDIRLPHDTIHHHYQWIYRSHLR